MHYKFAVFFSLFVAANAGYLAAPAPAYSHASYAYEAPHAVAAPAVVNQQGNILRSHGNLEQVSTFSKSISTPHSSVYKSDVRVSKDALAYPYAQGHVPAPVYSHTYAVPAAYSHGFPPAPAYAQGYAAAAPVYGHVGYSAHAPAGFLGVAYSPATAAAHFSYSNGYGLHYSY